MPEAVPESDATKSQKASANEVAADRCRLPAAQGHEVERDQRGAAPQVERHLADAGCKEEIGQEQFAVEPVAAAMQKTRPANSVAMLAASRGELAPLHGA